jgi:hypothetical protein
MTYESQAISKSMSYKFHFPRSGMEWVRRNMLGTILPTPLPGNYGQKYKFRRLLINHLNQHNGSMFDPAPDLKDEPVGSKPIKIEISEPVRRRLLVLRQFLDENSHRIDKKLLILSPTNLRSANSDEMRERILAAKEVGSLLGIELKNVVNPVEHLPDHLFVGYHHLTRTGQTVFTELLDEKLNSPHEVKLKLPEIASGSPVVSNLMFVDFSKESPFIKPYAPHVLTTKFPLDLFSKEARDDIEVTGLSGLESNDKESWRWATGPATSIKFYVDPTLSGQTRQFVLKLAFKNGVPIPDQTVTIRLNGKSIRSFSTKEVGIQKQLDTEISLTASKGNNTLELVYKDWNHGKKDYGSNDPRKLAVVVMNLSLHEANK